MLKRIGLLSILVFLLTCSFAIDSSNAYPDWSGASAEDKQPENRFHSIKCLCSMKPFAYLDISNSDSSTSTFNFTFVVLLSEARFPLTCSSTRCGIFTPSISL